MAKILQFLEFWSLKAGRSTAPAELGFDDLLLLYSQRSHAVPSSGSSAEDENTASDLMENWRSTERQS